MAPGATCSARPELHITFQLEVTCRLVGLSGSVAGGRLVRVGGSG